MLSVDNYIKGNFPFPKHDIDPDKKDAKWIMDFGKAIFSAYVTSKTSIPYSQIDNFALLRSYGNGAQPTEKYLNVLMGEDESNDGIREGWMNINQEILSVMPKFKQIVIGMFEKQDHDIVATAVDPASGSEREAMKWAMWFRKQYEQQLQSIKQGMGDMENSQEYLPESIAELELMEDMGAFKLKKEKAIEQGLDYTFYISEWKETKRKMIEDFVDLNCAASKDYVDLYTQKVHTRYSNPSRLIMQYSRRNNHRNSEYGGEIIQVNIVDLRRDTDLPEDKLMEIAQKYEGVHGNPTFTEWSLDALQGDLEGTFQYDNFWIDVLDFEVMSINSRYRTSRTNKRGDTFYHDSKWGEVYDADNKKTEVKKFKVVYRGKWIMYTDFIYDHGLQYDVPRPGKKEVELSFHFYKIPGRSLVDLCLANLDDMQLAWLKFQNALAMAAPRGIAVEYSSLQNMTLGGKANDLEPMDILDIREQTGRLFYRASAPRSYVHSPHAGRIVQELEGGMGDSLSEFMQIFEMNLNFIRELTGINKIADASSPDPEQSVGGSQLAVVATNNVLSNIYTGYLSLKEYTAKNCALRLQLIVKYNKKAYEGYYPVLGKANLQVLSMGTEILDADYSLKIEARPDEQMKQATRQILADAMKPDRDGFVGIEPPEALMINRMIEYSNLKLAEAFIAFRISKNKQLQRQLQDRNMELNAKHQQDSDTNKHKLEQEKADKEFQRKKELQREKYDLEERNDKNAFERERTLKLIEAGMQMADRQIDQQQSPQTKTA